MKVYEENELESLEIGAIKETLRKDGIATCAKCCCQRAVVTVREAGGIEDAKYSSVACPDCGHNIAAATLEQAVNAWNKELMEAVEAGGEEDLATEITFR